MLLPFQFGIKDFIDILLVSLILYYTYRLLKRSGAVNLFWGILAFIVAWFLVTVLFHLELTGALFDRIISVGAIALIVIFQNEIRTFFYRVGARFTSFKVRTTSQDANSQEITQIVLACRHLANTKTGALIILSGHHELKEYADTGETVDSIVSAPIIENIFFKNTPLHDGAIIITNHRICAAACILPVSKNPELPLQYGLRHRAALGMTEKESVTLAIVVSEETGHILVAQEGQIRVVSEDELTLILSSHLNH